ncbi:SRR1-like protein [Cotesia glomerata]|uniref:SRR1-like protein n=1 Tax=Cotesia glomerata TaxID=32391 RepID=UPI001D00D065|nr:SRR1-like protein [Cotesia glomerata]
MPGLDEFQVVRRRRPARRRRIIPLLPGEVLDAPEINTEQLIRSILDAVIVLRNSPYRQTLYDGLSETLSILDRDAIPEIVCYGLGNFSQCRSSKHQLAALLTIKSRYKSQVFIYDPVFYPQELEVLKILGLSIIPNNEQAVRPVNDDTLTLFYMPHLFKGLIANCIYANWGADLNNCILVTNSFKTMVDDFNSGIGLDAVDDPGYPEALQLIKKAATLAHEIVLDESFDDDQHYMANAFNSTSIHLFTKSRLDAVSGDFWAALPGLPYRPDDAGREL